MTTPISVRALRRDDFAVWRALFEGYNTFYGRSGTTRLAEEVLLSTWSRFFDPAEPMQALVAERDRQLLGLAHILYHRSTIHLAPVCYLQDLFTIPEARGQGVARALIAAVYEHARQAGSARVYWHTQETNAVAMRLYDRVAQRSGFLVYRHDLGA